MPRVLISLFAIPVLVVGAACSPDDGSGSSGSVPSRASTTTLPQPSGDPGESATDATEPDPSVGNDGELIEIVVEGGAVVDGPRRWAVSVGDSVTLRVSADVADEVHLHGYDHSVEVAPGAPAELSISADIPGIFEVELEDRGLRLADLEVS